jgi:hypothetical protein
LLLTAAISARFGLRGSPPTAGWGDDGRTLYITAETDVYRIRLDAAGF